MGVHSASSVIDCKDKICYSWFVYVVIKSDEDKTILKHIYFNTFQFVINRWARQTIVDVFNEWSQSNFSSSLYIYFSSFFSLSTPFFFIRSCVIFHVVFQSSRLVAILLPDGHCVSRWVMGEYVCLSFFLFNIFYFHIKIELQQNYWWTLLTIEILIKYLNISFYVSVIMTRKNVSLDRFQIRSNQM
jgi:hypothetical protein